MRVLEALSSRFILHARRHRTLIEQTRPMSRTERIAKAVIEHMLPGSNIHDRTAEPGGVHDFDLRHPDGTSAAVEVTLSADQQIRDTVAAIESKRRGGRFLNARMCRNGWIVHPLADANINRLHTDLDSYLARVEATGLTTFFSWADASGCEAVSAILNDLRIEAGSVFTWKGGRQIGITAPGQGGEVAARHVQQAVEVEAQKKDNRNKLRRAGAIETHLFVYVDPRNYLPWVSRVSGSPPIYPPQLPPEITRVWAVTQTRTPGEYIFWRANRCSGWLAEAPAFIPEAGDSA
jgi:hypothetical protein